ncbi:MAG TPA: D-cysteine desulfhydrase family protein [Anaerolineae bacterium]|nr:D-cysteine desulfhydrase family protein [Anaerolineae bacterium]
MPKQPNYPAHISLALRPTPIEPLPRLSKHLGGPEIYVKRDDLTGLATGGNKTRKLEFLIADALAKDCDHLVTIGSIQSNHCRQTAAAAAKMGLGCTLILRGSPPQTAVGNLLIDQLLGAHIYWAPDKETAPTIVEEVIQELKTLGRTPYLIPYGGSNVMGATGYVLAMQELNQQLDQLNLNIDFILTASSSGGTQAGMVVGAHAYQIRSQILGISIDQSASNLKAQVGALATATATHLGLDTLAANDLVNANDDYLGEGYAIVGEQEQEAIQLTAQKEGLLLDPVYTGRAMAGLIDLIRWGAFTRRQTVLFWHTGGTAALSAFAPHLQ